NLNFNSNFPDHLEEISNSNSTEPKSNGSFYFNTFAINVRQYHEQQRKLAQAKGECSTDADCKIRLNNSRAFCSEASFRCYVLVNGSSDEDKEGLTSVS